MESIVVALIGGVVMLAGVVANLDLLVGTMALGPEWKALVVALLMAVLSPVMAAPRRWKVLSDLPRE